ncbi:hypothetical protein [Bradyrhizobium sp. LHD-71]|uniref:hypothetical protein n=1 Tax=Bradyrhizobium sp. LHD-71 TaxID=3072141 RepID=UPI00280F063C|nr:hypothetical protein [Bradyrhizobium sp. LHD-71]MDQ8732404.1 hypothetical protein [Bradyrhizobium sp. LHD-71]
MDEVTRAANDIKGFSAAFTKAIWLRKFGQEMICDQVLEVRGAPRAEEVFIPFFVQMPGEQPLSDLTTFR